ncbi:hypothetical protein BDZ94DRAFT_1315965, partial [Collybia nuda]
IDTQGLLDRVFPLPTPDSLRSLLKHAADHPLSRFRTAIQCLVPISSLPRSNPSPTALQQRRFCTLASSLLDHASSDAAFIDLDLSSFLPPDDQSTRPSSPSRPRKYALVQHLPSGDYWTSLNSDADLTTALKDLPTAQAELVAILPTPPPKPTNSVPTLAAYRSTKPLPALKPLPAQRRVTTGAFLDYGPWASFAPVFDQDAQIVGQRELGEVIYGWEQRKKEKLEMWRQRLESTATIEEVPPVTQKSAPPEVVHAELEQLLAPDEVDAIKTALGCLELENAVQELLERNRRALARLEELQYLRLTAEDGENSTAKEGSEEWDTAQGILDSLAVLASLRPRAVPSDENDHQTATILPPPHVLHKLHRTLALEPSSGWFGTLPPTRSAALRDDNTVKIRSGATTTTAVAATTTTPVPTATTPAPATAPVTMTSSPYPGYPYTYNTATAAQQQQMPYQPQPYRPQSTGTTAGTTPTTPYAPYKPQYYPYAPQQQGAQQSYYGQQQQGYAAAAYSGWYSAYSAPQQAQAQVAGGSGRGTPQPAQPQAQLGQAPGQMIQMQMVQPPPPVIANATTATYGSFFGGTPAGVARTPAVANTVYTQAQGAQSSAVPTLPAHLRTTQTQPQSQASTPVPTPVQAQQAYYGTYQTPGPAR